MATVDSKGRIVLPKDARQRLGLSPGTEVAIREEEGRIVVEPEDDPAEIIDDIERLITAASADVSPSIDGIDQFAKAHLNAIQRGAGEHKKDGSE